MLKRILLLTIAAAMMALAIVQTAYAAWLTGWSYRKKITIDYTKIDDTITNFPVRVYLNGDGDIGAAARSDGFDIRFTEYNGVTLLKYEREGFAIAASQATGNFWVKIPTIASASDTEFYIYYGKADATDGEDATNVWTNGQTAVWLMKEGTGITVADSTGNGNNGTFAATGGSWADGKIGYATDHEGTMYVDAGEGDVATEGKTALTLLGWIYKRSTDGSRAGLFRQSGVVATNFRLDTSSLFSVATENGSQEDNFNLTGSTDQWIQIGFTYDGAEIEAYRNGVSSGSPTAQTGTTVTSTNNLEIGRDPAYSSRLNGLIDTLIIYNRALSAAEIKADFNSGNNSLLSLGVEETETPAATVEMRGGVTLKENLTIKTQ